MPAPLIFSLTGAPSGVFGGFSGLCVSASPQPGITLITLSDRGPNREAYRVAGRTQPQRPFLDPAFNPEIIVTRFDPATGWHLESRTPLRWQDGAPVTGIPNSPLDEDPVDIHGRDLMRDPRGLDNEGLAIDARGVFWIAEEYGPSLLKVTPHGTVLTRYLPEGAPAERYGERRLPAELGTRGLNRGFEGAAIVDDTLYAFLQSPGKGDTGRVPVLAWDTRLEKPLGMLSYPLSHPGADKIGDATPLPDGRLLVLEQDGGVTPDAKRKVFAWDPRTGTTELLLDLTARGYFRQEKIEGLALLNPRTLAVVCDNDYAANDATRVTELAVFAL